MKKRYFDIYVPGKNGYSTFVAIPEERIPNVPNDLDENDEIEEDILTIAAELVNFDLSESKLVQYIREIELDEYLQATGKSE